MLPELLSAGGQLLGGLMGMKGQSDANKANATQAREQMAFQERMSNTSWQRGVEDMKKAGLNPALAYEKGGAPSPSGTAAHMDNAMASAGGTARAAADTYNNLAQTRAQVDQTRAQTELTRSQSRQLQIESLDRAADIAARARMANFDVGMANTLAPARIREAFAGANSKDAQATIDASLAKWTPQRLERENQVLAPLQLEQLRQQIGQTSASARSANASARLMELAEPRNYFQQLPYMAAEELWKSFATPLINKANRSLGTNLDPRIRK